MKFPAASRLLTAFLALLLLVGVSQVGRWFAPQPVVAENANAKEPPVSAYAPLADVVASIEAYLEEIEDNLEDPEIYAKAESKQEKVVRAANTIAVLAMALGKHDEKNKWQPAAESMIDAAEAVGENASDYADAKAALDKLKALIAEPQGEGETEWQAVGDLVVLMKQVPIVNSKLRRGVSGRRFEREMETSLQTSATLAAIAQASVHNVDYASDDEEAALWRKISADFRDASGAVNKAVRAKDQDAAKKALAEVVKSCDACHEVFR